MGTRHQYDIKHVVKQFFDNEDVKSVVALLAVELAFFLFTVYKGLGTNYLPVTLFLMVFTVVGCGIAFYFETDKYLLIVVVMLLNMGFVVQEIQSGDGVSILNFVFKFSVAMGVAFGVAFLYQYFAYLLRDDRMVFGLMVLQIGICALMFFLGTMIGKEDEQGAIITFGGITLFEIVKVMYVFIAAALLCKENVTRISVLGMSVNRELVLIVHTMILSVFFLLCKELGTLLVLFLTGLVMLWIFGKSRKIILALIIVSVVGFASVWFVCDTILYPMVLNQELALPNVIQKLVERFGTALHPEVDFQEKGYQGTLALEALAIGGLFGISTERYRLPIPESSNDFIFANLVQTCGIFMGIMLLIFFFVFLKRGMEIANSCEDTYFQGLAMAITLIITIETVIHIGYNMGCFPITGIPLYFVSQGFLAIITGMALVSILLVISADMV